jgi:hypothetical protein
LLRISFQSWAMEFLVGRRGPPQNSSRSQRDRTMQLKKAVPPSPYNKQQGAEERLKS